MRTHHVLIGLLIFIVAIKIYGPKPGERNRLAQIPNGPAPEIVGKDIDEKDMKLSDFRGKVVLLDFWGHW